MTTPEVPPSGRHGRQAKTRTHAREWWLFSLVALVAVVIAGLGYAFYPRASAASPVVEPQAGAADGGGGTADSAPGPAPIAIATAKMPQHTTTKVSGSTSAVKSSLVPLAGGGSAGKLVLDEPGSALTSWNQTSSYCPATNDYLADGAVGTDPSGGVTLTTSAKPGSCVALISPQTYSSDVVEADIYFPAVPGKPGTIANWSGLWLTDATHWPDAGELDATEIEPIDGQNAVTWHSGSSSSEFTASTASFSPLRLPVDSANLTPGWHTVDVVYTKGYFAVYYDGHEFTSYSSANVTGAPLNVYFTMVNSPPSSAVESAIGGPPVNSANAPVTLGVKYLRIWASR